MTSIHRLAVRLPVRLPAWCALLVIASSASACKQTEPASFSFYDDRVAPIIDVGCQRQTTGCHVDDGRGFALGNLDLSSYDSLMRRHDVLAAYGPYPVGLLLLKAGSAVQVDVTTIDPPVTMNMASTARRVSITTDVRHGGGEGAIAQGSRNYAALKQWIDGGYTRTGVPDPHLNGTQGECVHEVPDTWPSVDLSGEPKDQKSFDRFVSDVQPILKARCAGSSCHGQQRADLYLTCGSSPREQRFNYEVAVRHVSEVAASSELLRRPLAKSAGGSFHEGGDIIASVDDTDYRKILNWAEDLVKRAPQLLDFGEADDGLRYFANRVEPMLVRKGCMFLNCHSPSMFHDLRLHGGSRGSFSAIAIRRNYDMSKLMLAIDAPDPNQSRLIAKNLCPSTIGGHGVQHRGGALFEDFGGCASADTQASADKCKGVDADNGDLNTIPAYCVVARWHDIERQAAIKAGDLPSDTAPKAVVFVTRPAAIGGVADFDTFHAGADLVLADATADAQGQLTLGATRSLLGSCGLGADVDIRGTAVSWDAKHIAFAARTSASEPLRIYEMASDGSACAPLDKIAAADKQKDGIQLHDFDPAYAPDGRIVFASTRGNLNGASKSRGPTRTPAALTPNANIYVFDRQADQPVRQLTYLSNQEVAPSFMTDGRAIFSTEKRGQDFHQLAARRQNLDGGDYHPLFAQRGSIGFGSATEVVELFDRNFALVAAPVDAADGGGTIAVVNRSIGPDQSDRDPMDRSYFHSLREPVPGALGGEMGVFRSPWPLPSGRILASCDLGASDLTSGTRQYGLCELDAAVGGAPRVLWQDAQRIAVEAKTLWARYPRSVFESSPDEVNGSSQIESGDNATVHFLDVPLLGTLLFANTRTGRPINDEVAGLEIFESRPPDNSATSFAALGKGVVKDKLGQFFQDLQSLGKADLHADGSLLTTVPGGTPLSLQLLDSHGKALTFGKDAPFTGAMLQREEMQFYPGEHLKQAMPRRLFNGICAGCHGSISGRELDAVVNVDVLTSASKTLAEDDLLDLR